VPTTTCLCTHSSHRGGLPTNGEHLTPKGTQTKSMRDPLSSTQRLSFLHRARPRTWEQVKILKKKSLNKNSRSPPSQADARLATTEARSVHKEQRHTTHSTVLDERLGVRIDGSSQSRPRCLRAVFSRCVCPSLVVTIMTTARTRPSCM